MSDLIFYSVGALILFWIYKRLSRGPDLFEANGIPHEKPFPIVGNVFPMFTGKEGLMDFLSRYYDKYKSHK
jgi:hypothetical protein